MPIDRSIFLIGYRGTGKSTVARHLAERLGCGHVDSDDLIVQRCGRTIAEIFAKAGETAFREMEQEVVATLVQGEPAAVALGGGAVLREANRKAIAGSHVVWLTASASVLAKRLSADAASHAQRPSLTGEGLLDEIELVLGQRMPIYRECATLVVDTENQSAQAVAEEICCQLASQ